MTRPSAILLLALLAGACAPVEPRAVATPPAQTEAPRETATPEPVVEPTVQPTANPPAAAPVRFDPPTVTVSDAAFPIEPTLALHAAPADDQEMLVIRGGVERYLDMLDHFRATGANNRNALMLTGRFGDAVFTGMKASRDVPRKFAIGSLRVDRYLATPWGTRALAEVTVTILDKAVDGSVPDQTETGRLRMEGDRLFVVDAWDYSSGTWFNGPTLMTAADLRQSVTWAVSTALAPETWIPGIPAPTGLDDRTPYLRAKAAYTAGLDRTRISSRTLENVRATIERYDTFAQIKDGLATVRVHGTMVSTDQAGTVQRTPFERLMQVFVGSWTPGVVDEQVTPGIWLSGGNLALKLLDVNTA